MSAAMEILAIKNPNCLPLKRPSCSSSMALGLRLGSSPSLNFHYFLKPNTCRVSIESSSPSPSRPFTPKGLGIGFHSLDRSYLSNRSIVPFAASHEESKNSEIEVEKEKVSYVDEESQEAWRKALDNLKQQALKMQKLSQHAYGEYSKKALVTLEETLVVLEAQTDKMAKEMSEDAKELLSLAAEKSPEPMKEVVETFASSTDEIKQISDVRDFYLGIPYGLLLQTGGFLSFMFTGSISAIRFGFILGGVILGLSLLSLKTYKRGALNAGALKGQTAIASIIFLREIRLLFQRASFFTFITTIISGAMVAFYLYRLALDSKEDKGSDLGQGAEN